MCSPTAGDKVLSIRLMEVCVGVGVCVCVCVCARRDKSAAEKRRQVIQESKFLGGDMEHTHLVKGLDFALLQKVGTPPLLLLALVTTVTGYCCGYWLLLLLTTAVTVFTFYYCCNFF